MKLEKEETFICDWCKRRFQKDEMAGNDDDTGKPICCYCIEEMG